MNKIEQQTKAYAGRTSSPKLVGRLKEFYAGAEWMLETAIDWLSRHGYEDQYCRYYGEGEYYDLDLLLLNFRKAMEK